MNYVLEIFIEVEAFRWSRDGSEVVYRKIIKFWYRMGYDYIRVAGLGRNELPNS